MHMSGGQVAREDVSEDINRVRVVGDGDVCGFTLVAVSQPSRLEA